MGTRGFYVFRYKKKYYMIYNPYDSYYSNLGLKLLKEVRQMVKNNEFEKWLGLFEQLQIIKSDDAEYTENSIDKHAQSFVKSLNSEYIIVENDCLEKINYNYLDGGFFYILDFDKKRFIVKENGFRRQKYNLFNGEINKVYFEDLSSEESEN
jgi:hypothetical protein